MYMKEQFEVTAGTEEVSLTAEQGALVAIGVVGLGPVGLVSLAGLAALGHSVVGFDRDHTKAQAVAAGKSPICEADLDAHIAEGICARRIRVADNLRDTVMSTDVTIVAVGTPSKEDGSADLTALVGAARSIGRELANKSQFHVVVIRSSMPPGTTTNQLVPAIEQASGRQVGKDFGVCFVPEFLREGQAIHDFFHPARTVIGATDERSAAIVRGIFSRIEAKLIEAPIEVAEMTKYVDNAWHATKVTFANEIGRLSKAVGIDSHDVMNLFVQDTKLNLSHYYLKPGYAYGGSCLPKDLRALEALAKLHHLETPLLDAIPMSNTVQMNIALNMVRAHKPSRVAIIGAAFKSGTDDMRESPQIALAHGLMSHAIEVRIFDPDIGAEPLAIADKLKREIRSQMVPSDALDAMASRFVPTFEAATDGADVVVIGHATEQSRDYARRSRAGVVIDLARVVVPAEMGKGYEGIAW